MGASLQPDWIDALLDSFGKNLSAASTSDIALVLVSVARLQHVTSYSWLQGVLEDVQGRMNQFDCQVGITSSGIIP